MALPPAKRIQLEDALAKLTPRIKDSPLQAGTLITKTIERAGLSIHDITIIVEQAGGLSQLQRDIRIRERWLELVRQLNRLCPWETFIKACATKVDLQTKWHPIMAQHLGVDGMMLKIREHMGYVPYEWLEQAMAMPDLDPNEYIPRSNYAEVCEPLESTLRACGRTPHWIAKTLTDFISRFSGRQVTVADVRFPKPPATREK